MNELKNLLSEQAFASICAEITMPNENTIIFKPKYTFHQNRHMDSYMFKNTDDGLFLSDCGATLANLNDVFELGEKDVIKNIVAILRQFCMAKAKDMFFTKIDTEKPIVPQVFCFMEGIDFLYSMKLFYL